MMDLVFISTRRRLSAHGWLAIGWAAKRALWELLSGHVPLRWWVRGTEDRQELEPPSQGGDDVWLASQQREAHGRPTPTLGNV